MSDSFEKRDEEPAVECIARFININYGHNQDLMNSCRRLHDYSFFIACVRNYLKKGLGQKEAIAHAIDECIEEGILEDVLVKHRAEVENMFLTTFDKKMYEEALRSDARREGLAEGREQGRALERANTERERQRADEAEAENARLREEIERLKSL